MHIAAQTIHMHMHTVCLGSECPCDAAVVTIASFNEAGCTCPHVADVWQTECWDQTGFQHCHWHCSAERSEGQRWQDLVADISIALWPAQQRQYTELSVKNSRNSEQCKERIVSCSTSVWLADACPEPGQVVAGHSNDKRREWRCSSIYYLFLLDLSWKYVTSCTDEGRLLHWLLCSDALQQCVCLQARPKQNRKASVSYSVMFVTSGYVPRLRPSWASAQSMLRLGVDLVPSLKCLLLIVR